MIAAVAILRPPLRPLAFKISAGQIIERQAYSLRKGFLIKSLLHLHPTTVQLIHGPVEVVLMESLCRGQSASRRQPGAPRLRLQAELGTGKEQPGVDHRLEQSPLA